MNQVLGGLFHSGRSWMVPWREARVHLYVFGEASEPSPPHLATLRDLVARWDEVNATLDAWLRALPPDGHVPLRPAGRGGFRVASCGFDEPFPFQADAVRVLDPDRPGRAVVEFCTGLPDGYATYEVVLEDGVPVSVGAFCS
jgi:hypothetical protein